ncbi:MAG: multidrug efflux SMR transporter [Clostridiales bacterium]
MHWLYLGIAGILEIVWAVGLKYSAGFSKLVPSLITIGGMIAGFYFLSLALKVLPMGTAYAIWTGIGTLGTVILGIILFNEPIDIWRLLCIFCILMGIVGLKLLSLH